MGNLIKGKKVNKKIKDIRETLCKITEYPWNIFQGEIESLKGEGKPIAKLHNILKEDEKDGYYGMEAIANGVFITHAPVNIEYLLDVVEKINTYIFNLGEHCCCENEDCDCCNIRKDLERIVEYER